MTCPDLNWAVWVQVNLSPQKEAVLREAFQVLAEGGEMHFSDIYSTARIHKEVRGCLAGIHSCIELYVVVNPHKGAWLHGLDL